MVFPSRFRLGWLILLLLLPALAAAAQPRVALVIGNAAYRHVSPLLTPVNDARAMAAKLEGLGFRVLLQEDATALELERVLTAFEALMETDGGVGLFYYAGHGVQVEGHNYLIPVDADIRHTREIRHRALSLERVLETLARAGNRVNLVLLDACRNNPFPGDARAPAGGLAPPAGGDTPTGTLIAYATAPDRVAYDGSLHGIYTQHLLKHLDSPGLTVEQIFKRVRSDVMVASGGRQMPWESSSLVEEFYFRASPSRSAPEGAQTPSARRIVPDHSAAVAWAEEALSADPRDWAARRVITSALEAYLEWAEHYLERKRLLEGTVLLQRARALEAHALPAHRAQLDWLTRRMGLQLLEAADGRP